jgi:hypothetical protein
MPELKKPEVKDTAPKTHKLLRRDPKEVMLANLKGMEAAFQAKIERIKNWRTSDSNKELATARAEDNLNNIREMVSGHESAKQGV